MPSFTYLFSRAIYSILLIGDIYAILLILYIICDEIEKKITLYIYRDIYNKNVKYIEKDIICELCEKNISKDLMTDIKKLHFSCNCSSLCHEKCIEEYLLLNNNKCRYNHINRKSHNV
jgi:hypothetical protein